MEVADRFDYYGLAGNLMMYLINVLHQPTATAAKNVNMWAGVSALFPLFGGLLADSFLGRFKTILLSSAVYLMVFLKNNNNFKVRSTWPIFFYLIYQLKLLGELIN